MPPDKTDDATLRRSNDSPNGPLMWLCGTNVLLYFLAFFSGVSGWLSFIDGGTVEGPLLMILTALICIFAVLRRLRYDFNQAQD